MYIRTATIIGIAALCAPLFLTAACGSKTSAETSEPIDQKKTGAGSKDQMKIPDSSDSKEKGTQDGLSRGIWAAFDNRLLLRRYDPTGKLTGSCDLSTYSALSDVKGAGITALAFANKETLLALVDPGDSGERIVAVNVTGEAPLCAVSPWFLPNTGFNNLKANRILPIAASASEYLRIFVPRENGVDRFTWSNSGIATRTIGPGDTPFVPAALGEACTVGTVTGAGFVGEGEQRMLLVLSAGEGSTRLNLVANLMGGTAGKPQCVSSFDYAASGQPTSAADTPVHAVQMPDRRVYVLFRNANSGAKIVRYDFTGTMLRTPSVLSQDPDDLGYLPRTMIPLTNNSLLLATGDFITMIDTASGKLIRRWQETPFTSSASSLSVEP